MLKEEGCLTSGLRVFCGQPVPGTSGVNWVLCCGQSVMVTLMEVAAMEGSVLILPSSVLFCFVFFPIGIKKLAYTHATVSLSLNHHH